MEETTLALMSRNWTIFPTRLMVANASAIDGVAGIHLVNDKNVDVSTADRYSDEKDFRFDSNRRGRLHFKKGGRGKHVRQTAKRSMAQRMEATDMPPRWADNRTQNFARNLLRFCFPSTLKFQRSSFAISKYICY